MSAAPPSGMPITAASAMLARLAGAALPGVPWVRTAASVTSVASVFADIFVGRRLGREVKDETNENLRALYRAEGERLRAARASEAPATEQAPAPVAEPALAPSAYLAAEGAREDPNGIEEGCVPCALGHHGAKQGMLERAADEAEQEGHCGPRCQAWYVPAVRESLALLRHDLTPGRIARTPDGPRQVIEAHMGALVAEKDALLAGADPDPDRRAVREAILGASSSIIEATRFTNAGDPVTHPLVRKRLDAAESDLLAGERGRVGALPPATLQRVRENRQDLLNRTHTPAELGRVAAAAEEIDVEVMAQAVQALSPADVRAAALRAAEVRHSFKRDLAAAAAPVQAQIAAAAGASPEGSA